MHNAHIVQKSPAHLHPSLSVVGCSHLGSLQWNRPSWGLRSQADRVAAVAAVTQARPIVTRAQSKPQSSKSKPQSSKQKSKKPKAGQRHLSKQEMKAQQKKELQKQRQEQLLQQQEQKSQQQVLMQQQQQRQQELQKQQQDKQAAAAVAAAAAIKAAQHLLAQQAGNSSSSRAEAARGSRHAGAAANGSSSSSRPAEVAGISYCLHQLHKAAYRAAGVLVYDIDEVSQEVKVLLVRERKGFWNMFAGKRTEADGTLQPQATAARELEEESHGLIPAAVTQHVLPSCPQLYSSASKMAIYLMRYARGQQLPELLQQRLSAGFEHPEAKGLDRIHWFALDQLQSAVLTRSRSSSSHMADSISTADESSISSNLSTLSLGAGAKVGAAESQPLEIHWPLDQNKRVLVQWLSKLAKQQAPAVGLTGVSQIAQQQQQEQLQQEQHLLQQPPAVQLLPMPAAWAAFLPSAARVPTAVLSPAPTLPEAAAATANVADSVADGSNVPSAAGVVGVTQMAAANSAAVSQAASVGDASAQPWAIAVWSGQHAQRQQQEARQEEQQQQEHEKQEQQEDGEHADPVVHL